MDTIIWEEHVVSFFMVVHKGVIYAEEIGNYIEVEQVRCSSVQLGVVSLYRGFLLSWMMH